MTSSASTATSATGEFSFANPGTFTIVFVGSALGPAGVVAYQNYSWTVFVAQPGSTAGIAGISAATSPHPGALDVYELAPGGSNSEDPAVDYESLGSEVLYNVYEALIAYNGSDTGPTAASYVPVLATCVPGSTTGANNCQSMYGSSMISGTDYTFAISKTAKFYDPGTGNSWAVYPTDVVFSLARTMAFSTNPGVGSNNGWILTQSLLPTGNQGWSTLHYPFNNTPENVMSSMTINDSTACGATVMANSNGCVTFHVTGGGQSWPYFLELISDERGSGYRAVRLVLGVGPGRGHPLLDSRERFRAVATTPVPPWAPPAGASPRPAFPPRPGTPGSWRPPRRPSLGTSSTIWPGAGPTT